MQIKIILQYFQIANMRWVSWKDISVKLIAYVLQHLILATSYYSLLTILFHDTAGYHCWTFFRYISEDSMKTEEINSTNCFRKIWFFLGFSLILWIIWNVCMQKKCKDAACLSPYSNLSSWNNKFQEDKLFSRLKNKFCRLFNIKCKLSVWYYIIESS